MAIQPQEEKTRTYSFPRLEVVVEWEGDYRGTIYVYKVTATTRTGKFKEELDGGQLWIADEEGEQVVAPPPAFDYTMIAGMFLEDLIRTKNLSIEDYVNDKVRQSQHVSRELVEKDRQMAEDMYSVSAALSLESLEESYAEMRQLWRQEVPRKHRPHPS